MALEKIAPLGSALPAGGHGGSAGARPTVGETIQLVLAGGAGDDLLATTPDGEPLRLAGLGRLAASLAPGDLLQVRVVATVPQLQLLLLEPPDRSRPETAAFAGSEESAAMRSDQLALRQFNRTLPEAAALAMGWRDRLLSSVEPRVGRQGSHSAAALALVHTEAAPTISREPPSALAIAGNERWFFSAYAWVGQSVTLRLLDPDAEDAPPPRRRPGTAVLRLDFDMPGLGPVTVQVELVAGGVAVALFIEAAEALRQVRGALPAIAATLARVDLPLQRCRLERSRPAPDPAASWGGPAQSAPGAALPPPLFRAAAEIMLVLAALPGAGCISPGSR